MKKAFNGESPLTLLVSPRLVLIHIQETYSKSFNAELNQLCLSRELTKLYWTQVLEDHHWTILANGSIVIQLT